jgi:regulator of replication initiation timing
LAKFEEGHHVWKKKISSKNKMDGPQDQEHLQRLSSQVESLDRNMTELREQADRLPSLSPTTIIHLKKVEERLQSLKHEIEQQQREKLSPSGASNADFFSTALPEGWSRGVSGPENIPYFLNHEDETTQWDHPVFSELMASILEMNRVKYCAYRLALKLRKIQQKLCLDLLDLEVAISGFDNHGLKIESHDMAIQVPEMELVLTSIYETLKQEEPDEVDVPLCVDLALNWLLNVYDPSRQGSIRVLSFKLGMLVLSKGPLTEKYIHMFKLVAKEKKLNPRQLGFLLHDCIQIPKFLGEANYFGGSNIEPSVKSCFAMDLKENQEPPKDIDAKHYLKWIKQEPQSMVWLPVLHRLASAEVAKHNTNCKACKMSPIIGFRYRCLKCMNVDLCHNCFFVGKVAKGHKADHPMQEYCTSTGTSVNLKSFGKSLRNSFRSKNYFKKKQSKLGYLPVNAADGASEDCCSSPLTLSPNLSVESRDLQGSQTSSLQPRLINAADSGVTDISESGRLRPDDEHDIIARFCHELTQVENIDFSQLPNSSDSTEDSVRMAIAKLEEENRQLTKEYESLREKRERVGETFVEN